ncbi:TIGR02678 family protein [Ramlibacter sp. AN1133]|uniref:TIGR02678 family protein n=1 Tax=Ramlibacter sp. AN1133 TaxID=3133429 RepID=UPI0030C1D0BF
MKQASDSRSIGAYQQGHQRDEFRTAVRALLMTPLMAATHEDLPLVRRNGERLREWFLRETGWVLVVERDGARLYKRPADLQDATRGLPRYDRRRYVLLCLACAVLERSEAQISLRTLGERLLQLAADPVLAGRGLDFGLATAHERRDLVAVCQTLLDLGVLLRVVGDEDGFVHGGGAQADALYDIQRRALSGMLAAARGPSTWPAGEEPLSLHERLAGLVAEHVPDSDEGRRTAWRHHLARRLLDDPVVYLQTLDEDGRSYFMSQRGPMAARLCEAAGLVAEQRAEGLALTDEAGLLTDVPMPAEGTEAHATLLVAEYLSRGARAGQQESSAAVPLQEVERFLAGARETYGRYWRKSAREAGGECELAALALGRLEQLQLLRRNGDAFTVLPALARFAAGAAIVVPPRPSPASLLPE